MLRVTLSVLLRMLAERARWLARRPAFQQTHGTMLVASGQQLMTVLHSLTAARRALTQLRERLPASTLPTLAYIYIMAGMVGIWMAALPGPPSGTLH